MAPFTAETREAAMAEFKAWWTKLRGWEHPWITRPWPKRCCGSNLSEAFVPQHRDSSHCPHSRPTFAQMKRDPCFSFTRERGAGMNDAQDGARKDYQFRAG